MGKILPRKRGREGVRERKRESECLCCVSMVCPAPRGCTATVCARPPAQQSFELIRVNSVCLGFSSDSGNLGFLVGFIQGYLSASGSVPRVSHE